MVGNDDDLKSFAQKAYDFDKVKSEFEDDLLDAGIDFMNIGWDQYDNSLEILGVEPEVRLSKDAQKLIYEAGFSFAFVNHTDKWETHYSWIGKRGFEPQTGWRVRYGHKADPPVDYHEVERFPEDWPSEWLETGYIRVREKREE